MHHSHFFSHSLLYIFLPLSLSLSLSLFFFFFFFSSSLYLYILRSSQLSPTSFTYSSSLFLHILSILFVSSTHFSSNIILTALLASIYRTFLTIPTLSIFSLKLEHSFHPSTEPSSKNIYPFLSISSAKIQFLKIFFHYLTFLRGHLAYRKHR